MRVMAREQRPYPAGVIVAEVTLTPSHGAEAQSSMRMLVDLFVRTGSATEREARSDE